MRRLALVVALSGCNQAFSLDDTRLVDAGHPFFDAPDAPPPTCPPAGTQLTFKPGLTQAVRQSCQQYIPSFTPGSATAMCSDGKNPGFYYGRLDDGMLPMEMDISCAPPNTCYELRTVPEGSDAFIAWQGTTVANRFNRLRRDEEG